MPDLLEEDSPLERMKKGLYTPQSVDGVTEAPLQAVQPREAERWETGPMKVTPMSSKMSGSTVFLIFAAGFFVLAGIVAATVLFLGGRSVSGDRLEITVEGPTTVSGGEEASFFITVRNNNPTVATGAELDVAFPEGTFSVGNATAPLQHTTISLGDIDAGATVRETVTATFFGEENQDISIPITVEYRTGNSSAIFVSNKTYNLVISTAPVTLSVTTLSEVSSGQPLTFLIKARSNAVAKLSNIAVKTDYPFGFVPTSSLPPAEGDVIVLGDLLPGEEKEIRIVGSLSGQEDEERVFNFTVGSLKTPDGKEFGAPYSSKEVSITIAKPFLMVGLTVNREDTDPIIIKAGELTSVFVSWSNQLTSSILDGRIWVALSGDALDVTSVNVTNGFYRSTDKTVLFDRDTDPGLKTLEPGDKGNGTFVFMTKKGVGMSALRNPSITMTVSVSGRRVGQGNVSDTVSSTLTRTIKIETDLSIQARAVRNVGPFENSGPVPPTPGSETTYTILMTSANTINTVANTVVKTTLPSYVRFNGLVSPASGVKYNESTREITWTIGEMAPGTSKEAAFQVAFAPSTSQIGSSPLLTSKVIISGHDRFVEQETVGEGPAVTIETRTDLGYTDSYGIVK